jgi:hypothetical protein
MQILRAQISNKKIMITDRKAGVHIGMEGDQ